MSTASVVKIALPHVIAVVIRDGHASPEEVARIRPIAVEYQAAIAAGTCEAVAKPLLERLMAVVGKERVKSALRQLNQSQMAKNAAAAASPQAAGAGPSEPGTLAPAPPGQKHALEARSAEPSAKRPRAGGPEAQGGASGAQAQQAGGARAAGEGAGAAPAAGKRGRKAVADSGGAEGAGGLLADVNLDDEQARLLAPRPPAAYGTRSKAATGACAVAAPAGGVQAGGSAEAGAAHEPRTADLSRWLGAVLQAEGLLPRAEPAAPGAHLAQLAELADVLDGGLRQHMRRLLCGMCDASQRRRESAATQAGLVRSDAPTGAGAGALAPAMGAGSGAASVTLKERVQLRDALHHLESERRTSKSAVLLWWRAVGSVRNRFPREPHWRLPAGGAPGGVPDAPGARQS